MPQKIVTKNLGEGIYEVVIEGVSYKVIFDHDLLEEGISEHTLRILAVDEARKKHKESVELLGD